MSICKALSKGQSSNMAGSMALDALCQLQEENQKLRQEVDELKQRLQLVSTQHQPAALSAPQPAAGPSLGTSTSAQPSPALQAQPVVHIVNTESSAASHGSDANSGARIQACTMPAPADSLPAAQPATMGAHGLTKAQVERYSRQLLLSSFGPAAQARLCSASALIVGCGGLGAAAALYLAAAGIGTLGLADRDTVELSNLHRQVIHTEGRVGQHKAASAAASCAAINSSVQLRQHTEGLTPGNAVELVSSYDVILDCSDNAPTRYLLSDACAACQVPLVSAAALGTDGQLTVYCHGPDGPCYRCLFPTPPAAQHCGRCSEAGVLGPVPGVMGVLQALEAIKLLAGVGEPLSRKLLLFDALSGRFSTVRLRARVEGCVACGSGAAHSVVQDGAAAGPAGSAATGAAAVHAAATAAEAAAAAPAVVTKEGIASYDYAAFTGQAAHDGSDEELRLLPHEQRVSARELATALGLAAPATGPAQAADTDNTQPMSGSGGTMATCASLEAAGVVGASSAQARAAEELGTAAMPPPVVLDVRPATQFDIMALPGAIHVPIEQLEACLPEVLQLVQRQHAQMNGGRTNSDHHTNSSSNISSGSSSSSNHSGGQQDGSDEGAQLPPVYVVCRRGNDSQLAVQLLRSAGVHTAVDLVGGYQAWAREVDGSMPFL